MTVTLDGSGTETGSGRNVTYLWTQTSGTGGTLTGETTLTPSFTAPALNPGDADAIHIFTLTVSDDVVGSTAATDTVRVTVTAPEFPALTAEAGPNKSVVSEMTVTLDGSGTETGSGRNVTYLWTQTSGTGGTLTSETTLTPSFTAPALNPGDADAIHIFTLTVSDDVVGSTAATDTVRVTVEAPGASPNASPVADAGAGPGSDQLIRRASGSEVELDGGHSMDKDGTIASYSWSRTGGTGDSNVELSGANTKLLRFTADILSSGAPDVTHVFELVVTDNDGAKSDPVEVTVTVFAVAQVEVDILVRPPELTVQEGGSSAYKVRLNRFPGQEVSVIAFSGSNDVVLENERLMFNEKNWDAWQEVRITTVADSDKADEMVQIQHRLVAEGVALGQPGVVSVTVRDEDSILPLIGKFLETRATTLLSSQPDLSSFLKQGGPPPGGSGGFTFRATNGRLALDGGFVRDGVWGEVTGSYANSDSGDMKFVLGSFGIHRKYSENFLAGAMLQFDFADYDLDGQAGTTDGTGWLVGPYFAARHGTRPLHFEGRLLYGQSDNDIRFNDPVFRVRTGSFDTTRLLAQLRVAGEIALSTEDDGPRLIPYADAHWIEDRAAAFTDSIGNRVSGQKVSVGEFELGSNVEVPIAMGHGAMTFTGGLGVVYSNSEGDYIPSASRSRGRGEIGLSYGLDDKVRIDFESFYDGIGTSGYEGYGLSLSAEMRF